MINKKLILENAIRFGFVSEMTEQKAKLLLGNDSERLIKLGIDKGVIIKNGDKLDFPADPTGKYEAWILRQLQTRAIHGKEDNEILKAELEKFSELKKRRIISGVDINTIDYKELKNILKQHADKTTVREERALNKYQGAKLIISKGEYDVYKISDANTCVKLAKGTSWCVAGEEWAAKYTSKNPLYLITKNGSRFALLSYPYQPQLKDPENTDLEIEDIHDFIKKMGIKIDKDLIEKEKEMRMLAYKEGYVEYNGWWYNDYQMESLFDNDWESLCEDVDYLVSKKYFENPGEEEIQFIKEWADDEEIKYDSIEELIEKAKEPSGFIDHVTQRLGNDFRKYYDFFNQAKEMYIEMAKDLYDSDNERNIIVPRLSEIEGFEVFKDVDNYNTLKMLSDAFKAAEK